MNRLPTPLPPWQKKMEKYLPYLPKKAHKHCKVTLDQMAPYASLEWILNLFHNVCSTYTFIIMQYKEMNRHILNPNCTTRNPQSVTEQY